MYRTEFTDIMYSVVQALDLSMTITDYSFVGNAHTATLCDLKWLQVGFTITIGGNDYLITSINDTTNVVVMTGAAEIETATFDIYRPYFRYGSPIDANNELVKQKDTEDKYPLVYLMGNFSEFKREPDSSIERDVSARLFALTDSNFKKWKIDDISQYAMRPMSRLMQNILDTIEGKIPASKRQMLSSFFAETFTCELIPRYKYGVYITDKGAVNSYFADNLSGWENSFNDLHVRRNHRCTQCVPMTFETGIGSMEIGDDFTIA